MPRVDDPQFEDNFESLVKALVGGAAVAFVGAGIGMRVGYPTWGMLLDELEELSIKAVSMAKTPSGVSMSGETLDSWIVAS